MDFLSGYIDITPLTQIQISILHIFTHNLAHTQIHIKEYLSNIYKYVSTDIFHDWVDL